MKVTKTTYLVLLALVSIVLSGCGPRQYRLGWLEASSHNSKYCVYSNFDQEEGVIIISEASQDLDLLWDVEFSGGAFKVQFLDRNDVLFWEEWVIQAMARTVNGFLDKKGHSNFLVTGQNVNGAFEVSWDKR